MCRTEEFVLGCFFEFEFVVFAGCGFKRSKKVGKGLVLLLPLAEQLVLKHSCSFSKHGRWRYKALPLKFQQAKHMI
jgi:hypothetical protein